MNQYPGLGPIYWAHVLSTHINYIFLNKLIHLIHIYDLARI